LPPIRGRENPGGLSVALLVAAEETPGVARASLGGKRKKGGDLPREKVVPPCSRGKGKRELFSMASVGGEGDVLTEGDGGREGVPEGMYRPPGRGDGRGEVWS